MIRINPQDLHWQNARARELILSGGSKAGVYRFLSEHPTLRDHLPENTQIMKAGEDPGKFTEGIRFGNRKKIIRGFHPLTFCGMIDVLRSIPKVEPDSLLGNIDIILNDAKSRDVMSFAEYEFGQKAYDGNIGIMSQDFYENEEPYFVVKNPHLDDTYIIEQIKKGPAMKLTNLAVYDFRLHSPRMASYHANEERLEIERAIIDLYKEISDSGAIPEGYSFLVELVPDKKSGKLIICEAKLFRKMGSVSDFYPEELHYSMDPWVSFGKTIESGLELNSDLFNEVFVQQHQSEEKMCYVHKSMSYQSSPLSIQPRNLYALLSFDQGVLVHGSYRWAMKADVFMRLRGDYMARFTGSQRLRICSNGFNGGVAILNE